MSIHPQTSLGAVSITVSNLEQSLAYYQQIIGLQIHRQADGVAYLGAGEQDLLILTEQAGARPADGYTGLYHFAILVPSRRDLALVLQHLVHSNVPLGASDHAVSEALYLNDPDHNGIEIYADRPREQWPYSRDGELQMTTIRLNARSVLSEITDADQWQGLPAGTTMGHIHLRVGDIPKARDFYVQTLGFDWIVDYGSQASFTSAGGYHHHIGMNTWESAGAPPRPANTAGLNYFTITLPDTAALETTVTNLREQKVAVEERDKGYFLKDPFQNGILLAAA